MTRLSRQDVVQAVIATAKRLGVDTLTLDKFVQETGMSKHQVYSLFPSDGWQG